METITAQETLAFERIYPDGICRAARSYFTKTIEFQDINYQLCSDDDQSAVFDSWCDLLNFFDSSVRFQLSFVNLPDSGEKEANLIAIEPRGDSFDGVRAEYSEMLAEKLRENNERRSK